MHEVDATYQTCNLDRDVLLCDAQDGTIQHEVKLTGEVSTTLASRPKTATTRASAPW